MKIAAKDFFALIRPSREKTILKNGLNANRKGEIFLFTKLKSGKVDVAEYIAAYRLNFEEYIVIKIDGKGVKGKLTKTGSEGLSGPYEFLLHQKKIESEFIKSLGKRKTDAEKLMEMTLRESISK